MKLLVECDNCPAEHAEVQVTLAEGQVFQVCMDCVADTIRANASTENPVHSVELLDEERAYGHAV